MREHRRLRADAGHERVAGRVAAHDVVEIPDRRAQEARVAGEAIRLHEHEPLIRRDGVAPPHEVLRGAHRDAVRRACRRRRAASARARRRSRRSRRRPRRGQLAAMLGERHERQRADVGPATAPSTRVAPASGGAGDEEAVLPRREKELRRGPAQLVVDAAVAVRARRRSCGVVAALSRSWSYSESGCCRAQRHAASAARVSESARPGSSRGYRRDDARRLRHHRREVERRGGALLHDVARRRRDARLLERVELRVRELVVHAAVGRDPASSASSGR